MAHASLAADGVGSLAYGFLAGAVRVLLRRVRLSDTYVVRMYERPGGLVCPSVVVCRHSFRAIIDTIRMTLLGQFG
jgi:hypothetical protein